MSLFIIEPPPAPTHLYNSILQLDNFVTHHGFVPCLYIGRGATRGALGARDPPAFHTLAKDMSLNRDATHFTLGLGHVLSYHSYYKYTCAPLWKCPSCAPLHRNHGPLVTFNQCRLTRIFWLVFTRGRQQISANRKVSDDTVMKNVERQSRWKYPAQPAIGLFWEKKWRLTSLCSFQN